MVLCRGIQKEISIKKHYLYIKAGPGLEKSKHVLNKSFNKALGPEFRTEVEPPKPLVRLGYYPIHLGAGPNPM